jgi:uncharacterized protein YxjI
VHVRAAAGEKYTIRRKVLKIFGAAFHIYDAQGRVVAYCKQKALRLREDLRIYTDESMGTELLRISTSEIIDIGATYTVALADGSVVGTMRQNGLRSAFVRDEWLAFNAAGKQIAFLREEGSTLLTVARHWIQDIAFLFPQQYSVTGEDGTRVATFRQHFNPFVFKMGVTVLADDPEMDELLLLGMGCLIAAIEGKEG